MHSFDRASEIIGAAVILGRRGEKVGLYVNGAYLCQLTATPKANDNTKATLSGTLASLDGITAIGTGNYALRYDNTLYSGTGQTLTFNYTGSNPEGKTVTFFANGQALQGNTLEMPASAVTVTASLEALVHYTVRFDKNKDSATGTMDDMTFVYGTAQKLTANAFSCTGYNFNRWNTQPDGTVTPANPASYNIEGAQIPEFKAYYLVTP